MAQCVAKYLLYRARRNHPTLREEPIHTIVICDLRRPHTMTSTHRRKVFVSFHSDDLARKNRFVDMLDNRIVDRSVGNGDIATKGIKVDEIYRQVREGFIADATVTVVLVGRCTWQRKHVDWEIGASLTDTEYNGRCGLLGIILPSNPNYKKKKRNLRLIPPRLACNLEGKKPFAQLYDWTDDTTKPAEWIDKAFRRRNEDPPPDNNYTRFAKNRKTECTEGWQ